MSATTFWATPSTTTTSRRLLRHLFREFAVAYESTRTTKTTPTLLPAWFPCPTSHVINSVITPGGFGNHYLAQNNKHTFDFGDHTRGVPPASGIPLKKAAPRGDLLFLQSRAACCPCPCAGDMARRATHPPTSAKFDPHICQIRPTGAVSDPHICQIRPTFCCN